MVSAFCVQHLNPEGKKKTKKNTNPEITVIAVAITQAPRIMVIINRRLQTGAKVFLYIIKQDQKVNL